jgi:hypothetical protein
MSVIVISWLWVLGVICATPAYAVLPADGPEEVLRALVRANAERDLTTMGRLMAHDADMIGYSIGGRKYVGSTALTRDMDEEFGSVARLELPIHELPVWSLADVAWFSMELDYIRYASIAGASSRTLLPLRETGVLERRNGKWLLVAWHESFRAEASFLSSQDVAPSIPRVVVSDPPSPVVPNLSGEWEIQEEDKSYRATLDKSGNGTYSWQGGRITTTSFADRKWLGTWQQPGNDREGGFEILLSEDATEAKGVWWYTRVGDRKNIPPRQWGGSYNWKRLKPDAAESSAR